MIDRDEDGYPTIFYAEALPCESCGQPTTQPRTWNAEHELWIAVDCECNAPEQPVCPQLAPALKSVHTVREVCQVIREHRRTCHLCRPLVEITPRKQPHQKPARVRKEAA